MELLLAIAALCHVTQVNFSTVTIAQEKCQKWYLECVEKQERGMIQDIDLDAAYLRKCVKEK